jgi:NADH-quinone oxidoreductase subunit L
VMYMFYPLLPMRLAEMFRPIYLLLLNKWYFDEIYDAVLVQPMFRLSRALWQTGDVMVIDGVPNGLAALTTEGSREAVKIQTGSLAVYAFVMLIGVVVLVGIFMVFR